MRIEHIAMYVNELEAARDFFVKYLGGKSNNGYHNKNTGFRSFFISFDDGARIELMNKPEVIDALKDRNNAGYIHICIKVDSKEKFEEILDSVDAGMREPEIIPDIPDVPDQEAKADAGKPRLSLVPMQILFDIAEVREYGNMKYPEGGSDNWKQVSPERFRDAMLRHMVAYIQDPQSVDEESGLKHLAHMACNIAFLCEMEGRK